MNSLLTLLIFNVNFQKNWTLWFFSLSLFNGKFSKYSLIEVFTKSQQLDGNCEISQESTGHWYIIENVWIFSIFTPGLFVFSHTWGYFHYSYTVYCCCLGLLLRWVACLNNIYIRLKSGLLFCEHTAIVHSLNSSILDEFQLHQL